MADASQRLLHNAPGDFFVDRTCIDCDQCREIAPETFRDGGSAATVYRQPASPEALRQALMALVACPVGAIGTGQRHNLSSVISAFPVPMEDDVHFCGFASSASFGASSYFIARPEGNVLVDSPRFASRLVQRIEQMGGIRWMFLSHVDDVADHARFRRHFGCDRILHRREIHSGLADIEWQIEGDQPQPLAPDLLAIPTPGHTRGHMVLLYRERFLFTGDHLWWSPERQQLAASRSYCWYSWATQVESMERLRQYRFEWVLPGHGRRYHASTEQMQESLARCITWMQRR